MMIASAIASHPTPRASMSVLIIGSRVSSSERHERWIQRRRARVNQGAAEREFNQQLRRTGWPPLVAENARQVASARPYQRAATVTCDVYPVRRLDICRSG
jgi:hypothetical protein